MCVFPNVVAITEKKILDLIPYTLGFQPIVLPINRSGACAS